MINQSAVNIRFCRNVIVNMCFHWFLFVYVRMVRDYVATNNTNQIQRLLNVLGQDFAMSQNPNSRKGGLIGLAATAIALSKVATWTRSQQA